jgi:hypothetical protein
MATMDYRPLAGIFAAIAFASSLFYVVADALAAPFLYLGSMLFAIEWKPAADVHLEADGALRSVQADTLDLTPLGERFKAFIRRRMAHRENIGVGFLPEAALAA